MGPSVYLNPQLQDQPLTPEEFELRVEFVRLYRHSQDAYQTCLSLGFMGVYAQDWAKRFLQEGVVHRLIEQFDAEEETEVAIARRKRASRNWMQREANYFGKDASHSARVTAIANLMKMDNMFEPEVSRHEVTHRGGVMMVPQITNPDEWGKHAAASQQSLKQTVRD